MPESVIHPPQDGWAHLHHNEPVQRGDQCIKRNNRESSQNLWLYSNNWKCEQQKAKQTSSMLYRRRIPQPVTEVDSTPAIEEPAIGFNEPGEDYRLLVYGTTILDTDECKLNDKYTKKKDTWSAGHSWGGNTYGGMFTKIIVFRRKLTDETEVKVATPIPDDEPNKLTFSMPADLWLEIVEKLQMGLDPKVHFSHLLTPEQNLQNIQKQVMLSRYSTIYCVLSDLLGQMNYSDVEEAKRSIKSMQQINATKELT